MRFSKLSEFVGKHPKSNKCEISYGTAGFRFNSDALDSIVFRVGALASLRSSFKNGQAIGLVITASHNPEEDNGIKIVDPNGELLEASWEPVATNLANVEDKDLDQVLSSVVDEMKITETIPGNVFIARDTRKSGQKLLEAALDGVKSVGGQCTDLGLLTTPQLHYIVHCYNCKDYGEPTEEGYYKKLSKAFLATIQTPNEDDELVLDCANGIGASKFKKFTEYVNKPDLLKVHLVNAGEGILNHKCGADFVKINQSAPEGVLLKPGVTYASFDGDADRIVFFYLNPITSNFSLIDGDKIAVLFTLHLKELVKNLGLDSEISFCVIQTAYANGSSTSYIKDVLGVDVACVPTGIKHLHHRAKKADIGVYFEANGHGTVLLSNKILSLLKSLPDSKEKQYAFNFIDMINQTTGDAISDLLLVKTILNNRNLSVHEWNLLYSDLPNRQLKVKVADRTVIQMIFDETKCTAPTGLQESIDEVISRYGTKARAFVRPSGTEDVVRIYAETDSQEKTDQLANELVAVVEKLLQ